MTSKSAVLSTLCYHDLFDYPLTLPEIEKFLIGNSKIQPRVQSLIQEKVIQEKDGFYFLSNREKIIASRRQRKKLSEKKLVIAQQASCWLKLIPSVKMVAVTGAVAVGNAKENDDIDFLIITTANRLWLTRLIILLLIEILGKRRKPSDIDVRDKICLNVFLDESYLTLPKSKRNLFTAHEICQMQVLHQKDHFYQRFLKANQWTTDFLPNWKK